jgi:hypothetical protein
VVHVPLAVLGQVTLGLEGLALALAVTTSVLLSGALVLLDAVRLVARGMAAAALVIAIIVACAYAPSGFLLGSTISAAALGTALYVGVVAVWRPPALGEAWRYLRTLS